MGRVAERKAESLRNTHPLPPTSRVSPRLLPPPPPPPAPRPRPGHLGPHPLRGLGSGSCSARLPRGGSCPKAAAGAAGAWPSEAISGVGPWGRLLSRGGDRAGPGPLVPVGLQPPIKSPDGVPSPAFPHPRHPPSPDSRALPPFPLPPTSARSESRSQKGKEVRTGARAVD